MKRPVIGLVLVLLVGFVAGCVNSARQPYAAANRPRPRAFALAVTVNGGLQPTPMQWAAIQAKFADEFAWRGWVLVTDLALADYIVRVDFTPDPADPENSGNVVVLGVRNSPRALLGTLTTLSPYPTTFSYAGTFQNALWSPGFSSAYYGWNDSYYDGYSYSSPTLNPTRPVLPTKPNTPYRHHHQPGDVAYCPPPTDGTRPHHHYLPGDFAPHPPAHPTYVATAESITSSRWNSGNSYRSSSASNSNRTSSGSSYARSNPSSSWHSDSSQSRPDRTFQTYARLDSDYSRSDSSSSRSGSSSSRSDSSRWHSSSDSNYSPSYSSSYSDSSSSSSSSSSSYSSSSSSDSSSSSSSSSGGGSSSSFHSVYTQPN